MLSPNTGVDLARTCSSAIPLGVVLTRERWPHVHDRMGVAVLAIGGPVVAGARPRFRPGFAVTVTALRLRAQQPPATPISATLWQATEQLAAISLPARERASVAVPFAASFAADTLLELRIGEGDGSAHGLYLDLLGTVAG